jgi:CheY-like chemotaxis protein
VNSQGSAKYDVEVKGNEQDSSYRSKEDPTKTADSSRGIAPGYRLENPTWEQFSIQIDSVPACGEKALVTAHGRCEILFPGRRRDMSTLSKQVLIVDNNEEEARTLASMLERVGHCPTTTWSGLEALELLKSREFDLVLVSSYLPDLYVGDFFERLNRLPAQPSSIVIQEGEGRAATLTKVKSMIGEEIHSDH